MDRNDTEPTRPDSEATGISDTMDAPQTATTAVEPTAEPSSNANPATVAESTGMPSSSANPATGVESTAMPSSNANPAPGPLPGDWATGAPTDASSTPSQPLTPTHAQAANTKGAKKARRNREPVFSREPPRGLNKEEREEWRNIYDQREAVQGKQFKNKRLGPSQRSRLAGDLKTLARRPADRARLGKEFFHGISGRKQRKQELKAKREEKSKNGKQSTSTTVGSEADEGKVEAEEQGEGEDMDIGTVLQPADHRPGPSRGGNGNDSDDDGNGTGGAMGNMVELGQIEVV